MIVFGMGGYFLGIIPGFISAMFIELLSVWWFGTFFFHFIYGMSSFPLTNFQDG